MENVDMFNAATAPLTFHDFLDRMRHPSAADLVRGIKSFIVSFSSNAPDPENDSRMVQDFLTRMEAAFKAHPLWAGATEDELDSAGEGLEKYLMTKLVNRAFAPTPADAKHDQELSEKISLVQQFIRPEHLDILPNYQNETSWLLAQKELQKINTYKAPRDKLVCILNCCRVINNLLLNVSMATNDNPPGADDFLPVLIYVTIKANPPQLHSNLLYIQRYRQPSRLVSEAAYFFTNMVSAESFISDIDAKSLSMDEDEFERNMTAARFALHSGQSTIEAWNFTSDSTVPKAQVPKLQKKEGTEVALPAVSENRANRTLEKGTTFIRNTGKSKDGNVKENLEGRASTLAKIEIKGAVQVLQADRTGKLKREYPFLYARAGDITVGDVELLLNAYKELVLKYVSLSKAVESSLLPNTHSAFKGDAGSRGINSIVSKDQNNQQVGSSADLSEANEASEGSQINNFNQEMKNIDQQVSSSADLSETNEASEGSHINNSNQEMKNSDEDGLQLGTETDHHESLFLSTRSVNTDGELHSSNRTETIEMEQFNTLQHAGGSRVDQASEEVTDGDIMAALDSEQSSVAPAEMLLSKDASPNDHDREGL